MIKQGYEPRMAAGVVAISGTLAMLMPTSVALVVYGLLAEVSIGKLLVSGIIPAICVTLTIMATILILIWRDPSRAPPVAGVSWAEKFRLLRSVGPMVFLFGTVTGAIYTGIATPTEASAVGALGAFVLAILKGGNNFRRIAGGFQHAAYGSCMIAMILLGAHVFSYAFALTQVTQDLVAWVGALPLSRWVIIAIILSGYIVLGSFMDQMAILVLTVPVVLPLIKALGFDPIWFGVIKIVTAEVGMITPPIGLNCFIVARYAQRPVTEVFHGTFPHFVAHIVIIAILVAFPSLILFLPSKMN
jgi:tripartite ATP-independent transporter DctM subunit